MVSSAASSSVEAALTAALTQCHLLGTGQFGGRRYVYLVIKRYRHGFSDCQNRRKPETIRSTTGCRTTSPAWKKVKLMSSTLLSTDGVT